MDINPVANNSEITLFTALNRANLTKDMVMQEPIVLKATLPDFCWPQKKKAVYLDGVHIHRKAHVERRDEEINALMKQKGWSILRILYEPPLTLKETKQIVEQIRDFINDTIT